jgi:hypothetical protein
MVGFFGQEGDMGHEGEGFGEGFEGEGLVDGFVIRGGLPVAGEVGEVGFGEGFHEWLLSVWSLKVGSRFVGPS